MLQARAPFSCLLPNDVRGSRTIATLQTLQTWQCQLAELQVPIPQPYMHIYVICTYLFFSRVDGVAHIAISDSWHYNPN